MYLHTVEPKTTDQLISRLREVERCMIRAAQNEDALEYIRTVEFISDGPPSMETMLEVKARIDAEFKLAYNKTGFGETWKI